MDDRAVTGTIFEDFRFNNGCKYHDNCFTCPFDDCIATITNKPYIIGTAFKDPGKRLKSIERSKKK